MRFWHLLLATCLTDSSSAPITETTRFEINETRSLLTAARVVSDGGYSETGTFEAGPAGHIVPEAKGETTRPTRLAPTDPAPIGTMSFTEQSDFVSPEGAFGE